MVNKETEEVPKIQLSAFIAMIVDFAFNKDSQEIYTKKDIDKSFHLCIQGVFPKWRFSRIIDDISTKICPDLLKEQMQRASNGKSKAQIELARRIEKEKDIVGISMMYKSKANKV